MSKVYWIGSYQSISKPEALASYAKLAGPAMVANGGRFMARGEPAAVFEAGLKERVVLIEFDSLEAAMAAYRSDAYQAALKALGDNSAVRDIRIVDAII